MKRIISLVLIMVLIVACMALPVLAEETDDVWINILDYGYVNNSNSNVVSLPADRVQVWFPQPSGLNSEFLDIIFVTDATDISIAGGDAWFPVHSLGDGVYRAFGYHNRSSVYLDILYSSGTYIEFLSVKSLPISYSSTPLSYYGHVYDYSYSPIKETYFSGDGSSPMTSLPISPNAGRENFQGFVSRIYLSSWNAYDYISLDIALFSSSFASLKVEMDGLSVPYEVNTIESTDVLGTSLYLLDITIDTRDLDRTSTSSILVDVSGMVNPTFTGNFTVRSCLGFVSIPTPSLWSYWFSKIQGWLSGGFASVISSLSSLGNNISSWITSQTNSLVSWSDIINTSLNTGFVNIGNWFINQTNSITNSFTSLQTHITDRFNALRGWVSSGYLSVTTTIQTWGQNISSTITSGVDRIVTALSPSGSANDFNDKVQQQGSELESMAGAMNAVTRPNVSTAIPDIGGYLTVSGPVTLAAVFDPFWKNSYILRLLLGSLAVSVAFTVVYGGKK